MPLEGARSHEAAEGAGQVGHGAAHRGRLLGEGGAPATQEAQIGVRQPGGEVAAEDGLQVLVETGRELGAREQLVEAEEGAADLRALDAVHPAEDVVENLAARGVQGDDALAQGAVEHRDLVADPGEVPGDLLGQGDDLGQALGGLRTIEWDEVAGLGARDLRVEGVALGAQSTQAPRGAGVGVAGEAASLRGDGRQARPGDDGAGVLDADQEADSGLGGGGQLIGLRPAVGGRGAHEHTGPPPLVAVRPSRARRLHARLTQGHQILIDQLVELGDRQAAHLPSQMLGEDRSGHRAQIGAQESQSRILPR